MMQKEKGRKGRIRTGDGSHKAHLPGGFFIFFIRNTRPAQKAAKEAGRFPRGDMRINYQVVEKGGKGIKQRIIRIQSSRPAEREQNREKGKKKGDGT